MDFGLVIWSAVIGGVLGGAGGLIGWQVGKQFPSKAKLIVQACSIAGAVIAITITPMVHRAVFAKEAAPVASANSTSADYDRLFRSDPLFGKIAEGWPSEYQVFLDDLVSLHGQIGDEQAQQKGFDFVRGIRRAHASNAFLADDAGLREYFTGYRDLLRAINTAEGKAICAAMVLEGPVALREREERYLKDVQRIGVVIIDLLLEGRRQRDAGVPPIEPPSQDALDAFEAYLFERTGERNLLERMRRGLGPDPCSNTLNVMSGLAEFALEQSHGRAVRVSVFHEIAAT